MLPYWHGLADGFCVRSPPPLLTTPRSQRRREIRGSKLSTSLAGAQENNNNDYDDMELLMASEGGAEGGVVSSSVAEGVVGSSSVAEGVVESGTENATGGVSGRAVASGRSLSEIEAAVELTRNNSNQQQRYEMRGGHAVEICSRVDFPDRLTRDVSVTVEATHSNGCHRVIMLKGLTAKKRPDLGPKVKDCRLRMDQIVMTRASTSIEAWQKDITMSYDSDFQVGLGDGPAPAL